MRNILMVVALSLCGSAAMAQQITPIYAEGKIKSARGSFTVSNLTIQNVPVTIEPKELVGATKDGNEIFAPLSSNVHLSLPDSSAVLPPKGSRQFDYKLSCDHSPCAVTFWTALQVGKTKEGITVQTIMMSTIYACDRTKNCRAETRKAMGLK